MPLPGQPAPPPHVHLTPPQPEDGPLLGTRPSPEGLGIQESHPAASNPSPITQARGGPGDAQVSISESSGAPAALPDLQPTAPFRVRKLSVQIPIALNWDLLPLHNVDCRVSKGGVLPARGVGVRLGEGFSLLGQRELRQAPAP